jgi:hypothetical protein
VQQKFHTIVARAIAFILQLRITLAREIKLFALYFGGVRFETWPGNRMSTVDKFIQKTQGKLHIYDFTTLLGR